LRQFLPLERNGNVRPEIEVAYRSDLPIVDHHSHLFERRAVKRAGCPAGKCQPVTAAGLNRSVGIERTENWGGGQRGLDRLRANHMDFGKPRLGGFDPKRLAYNLLSKR